MIPFPIYKFSRRLKLYQWCGVRSLINRNFYFLRLPDWNSSRAKFCCQICWSSFLMNLNLLLHTRLGHLSWRDVGHSQQPTYAKCIKPLMTKVFCAGLTWRVTTPILPWPRVAQCWYTRIRSISQPSGISWPRSFAKVQIICILPRAQAGSHVQESHVSETN